MHRHAGPSAAVQGQSARRVLRERLGSAGEPALLGPKCRFARPPVLWIYGHNHLAARLQLGDTLTLTNPRGYLRERTGFDPGLVVAV